MKLILRGLLLLALAAACAFQTLGGQTTIPAPDQNPTAYGVAERGPHHRVMERIEYIASPLGDGRMVPKVHRYTELATGMHYQKDGQWVESKEIIEPLPDGAGAVAQQGQHKVIFPNNLNGGIVEMSTPDNKWLRSRILGLSYFDTATGKSVLIAEITNSTGQIVGENQMIYPNTFTDFSADVRYTYRLRGFEQDVILHERPPLPEKFGLNSATTRLQVLTEFLSPPEAAVTTTELKTPYGNLSNDNLNFGVIKMGSGRAFPLADETQFTPTRAKGIPVGKQWLNLDGRQVLVEEVMVPAIATELDKLPVPKQQAKLKSRGKSVRYVVSTKRLLPSAKAETPSQQPVKRLARNESPSQGLVLDYEELNTSQSNYTFQADTTYFITGYFIEFAGTTTFEGGTVVKFPEDGSGTILCSGDVDFKTASYRPVLLTSESDDSVGEILPSSTGTPSVGAGNDLLLSGTNAYVVKHLHARYAYQPLCVDANTPHVGVWHSQFLNCVAAIPILINELTLRNTLFVNCDAVCYPDGGDLTIHGEHVTVDHSDNLIVDCGSTYQVCLTNSILTYVTNINGAVLQNCLWLTNGGGIYQTVGAAGHYLATNSPYRNAGTTNINSDLLADLKNKTTYPPIVYSNATYTTPSTLGPQAQRDTDTPDLGYHYDPIDYAFGATTVDTDLTFSPGTAVAWFRIDSNPDCGIYLSDRKKLVFDGTQDSRCHFVRNNTVQEQANNNWTAGPGPGAIEGLAQSLEDNAEIIMKFTACATVGIDQNYFSGYFGSIKGSMSDCEFYGGAISGYVITAGLTNCLYFRGGRIGIEGGWGGYIALHNCTLIGGDLYFNRWENSGEDGDLTGLVKVSVVDSTFDHTYMEPSGDFYRYDTNWTRFDYNAFLYGADRTDPQGTHDVLVTNSFNWQSSWLGDFYLPDDSTLIDAGSLTNAALIGLYHFTTQTNQVKETNSWLDIGYHYVAVNTNGVPVDTDGDGVPDYLEDANGNGTVETGETDWQSATDLGLRVFITRPRNGGSVP